MDIHIREIIRKTTITTLAITFLFYMVQFKYLMVLINLAWYHKHGNKKYYTIFGIFCDYLFIILVILGKCEIKIKLQGSFYSIIFDFSLTYNFFLHFQIFFYPNIQDYLSLLKKQNKVTAQYHPFILMNNYCIHTFQFVITIGSNVL